MAGWLGGHVSWGVLLVGGTVNLPEALMGNRVMGGVLSLVIAPLLPLLRFLYCRDAGEAIC